MWCSMLADNWRSCLNKNQLCCSSFTNRVAIVHIHLSLSSFWIIASAQIDEISKQHIPWFFHPYANNIKQHSSSVLHLSGGGFKHLWVIGVCTHTSTGPCPDTEISRPWLWMVAVSCVWCQCGSVYNTPHCSAPNTPASSKFNISARKDWEKTHRVNRGNFHGSMSISWPHLIR